MIDCVYYNEFVRCYRDGRVERCFKRNNQWGKKGDWEEVENTANDINGYNLINIDNQKIRRHRLIAFCWLGLKNILLIDKKYDVCDHEDGDPLNNCIDNLRVTTQKGNMENRSKSKGYTKRKNKYEAYITTDRKLIYLGLFTTEEEARQAYLKAKEIYHTSFNI